MSDQIPISEQVPQYVKDPCKHNIYYKDVPENDFLYFVPKSLYGIFLCTTCRQYIYNMMKQLTQVGELYAWTIYMCNNCRLINKGISQATLNMSNPPKPKQ